jgi:uncharacterized protein YdhG (YjbR/CyaY superfamily)
MKKTRASRRKSRRTPDGIDAYLAEVHDEHRRAALARLRGTILAVVPDAVECISYGIPAFRVGGRVIAGFQARSIGCSYYPFSGSTLDGLGDALAGFSRTKSALHFDAGRPLSAALVRKLIHARLAELPGPSATARGTRRRSR